MAYPGAKMAEGGGAVPVLQEGPQLVKTWHIPEPNKGGMFKHQRDLPKLPVPDVKQSLVMYGESVKRLCTREQWAVTSKAIEDFVSSGAADRLQKRLLERQREKAGSSWLIDWWNELSYFGYRDPVVVYVSYYYQFVKDTWSQMSQVKRAAAYIKASLRYRDLITTETLKPEMSGKTPVDMSMYKYLFNAVRVPHPGKDFYATYDASHYHHIVVMRAGRAYKLETRLANVELSLQQLEHQISEILASDATECQTPIGLLTSENRDKWAAARSALMQHPTNVAALDCIGSSVMVVCLDDSSPQDDDAKARNLWHGNGFNRWYDKPLQFIIAANGEAGFLGEHGIMDGTPTNACVDWVLTQLSTPHTALEVGPAATPPLPRPEVIPFVSTPPVTAAITAARTAFSDLIGSQTLRVLSWPHFGKQGIKKLQVSPDAFCQMAIQLAYKRLNGKWGPTYEACSTRGFLHGRTETVRSCHEEGCRFVELMDKAGAGQKERYEALQKAAKTQSQYAKKASQGQGCDRHLLGLKLLVKDGEEMPALFKDPMYSYSSSWVLSTSALASEHFASWGFGEVVSNGYGVGYLVNKNSMAFTLTSRTDLPAPAAALHSALNKALFDMHEMCKAALSSRL